MSKEELSKFIKALEMKGLLNFNVDDFDVRFKIQKYVFLAKALGLKLDYNYNLYVKGPYCSELADDYYNIKPEEFSISDPTSYVDIVNKLAEITRGKDLRWLELSSTIISLHQTYKEYYKGTYNFDNLIKHAINIKPWASEEYAKKVYKELISVLNDC